MPATNPNLAASLFERARLEGWGRRVALRQGDRAWTYDQLGAQVGRVASALRSLRVSPGERVALLMRDTLEAAASLLGVIHAGAVAVPLSELSTATDVKAYLQHAGVAVAIVEASLEPALDEIRAELPALREVLCVGAGSAGLRDFHAMVAAAAPHGAPAVVLADHPSVLLYSAGAGPDELRGVPHTAATIAAAHASFGLGALGLGLGDRILSTVRLATAFGLGCGLFFPLTVGAEVALMPEQPRSETLFAALEQFVPTVMCSTPTVFAQLAHDAQLGGRHQPLVELRRAVAGAEGLSAEQATLIRDALGVPLTVGFGLTETFSFVLAVASDDAAWPTRGSSCGRPLTGVDARVVDDDGALVGADVIGTLQLRTGALFTGYWGDAPEADAPRPDGWFTTRDRFMVDEAGLFHHCGRIDDLFKVGGKWVSPQEIERVLTAHESVWECAVIGAEDEDGFAKPLAFVVANVGEDVGPALEESLRAYVKQTLAPYKYPRWIEFVDELPRGPSGKVLRYRLRAPRRRLRAETGHR